MFKNNVIRIISILIFIVLMSLIVPDRNAKAGPSYDTNKLGQWMFTVNGNDNEKYLDDIEDHINQWFSDNNILYKSDLEFLEKLEDKDEGKSGDFSFYWNNGSHKSGSWVSLNEEVKFYSIKAGNQYAMYWVGDNIFEGSFNTEQELLGKDLSHITFWTNNNTYTSTPEPATMLLLGLGLLGVAYTSRKE